MKQQAATHLPEEEKQALRELAFERRQTVSELIRELVRDELEAAREAGELPQTPDA